MRFLWIKFTLVYRAVDHVSFDKSMCDHIYFGTPKIEERDHVHFGKPRTEVSITSTLVDRGA